MDRWGWIWLFIGIVASALAILGGGYAPLHGSGLNQPIHGAPWDPYTGMAFAAIMLRGLKFLPLITLAEVLPLINEGVGPVRVILEGAVVSFVWGTGAWVARRKVDPRGLGQSDLVVLIGSAGGAAIVESVVHCLADGMSLSEMLAGRLAAMWTGNMIGVMVVTPVILGFRRPMALPTPRVLAEIAVQIGLSAGALALVVTDMNTGRLRWFYLLFLPAIWASVRFGLRGATMLNLVLQTGLATAFAAIGPTEGSVADYQVRMVVLAVSTLFLGAAVSQRWRLEGELRIRQEQFARTQRLSTAGEMAAALAHELNQPLTAIVNFSRVAQRLQAQPHPDTGRLGAAMNGIAVEADRAARIIRALREFIGEGRLDLRPRQVSQLVSDAAALIRQEAEGAGIRLEVAVERGLPAVNVDEQQIQQVITNLVRNAMDSINTGRPTVRQIAVSAGRNDQGDVEIEISDSGPGLDADAVDRLFQPFTSTKPTGMGLGLSICRTIIGGHGGRLWLAANTQGRCAFRFTLPVADAREGEG